MRIDILTIFPSLFDSFLNESLLAKARAKGIVDIRVHDLRQWADNKHRKVDDTPFGGGSGMVLMPQPIADALEELKQEAPARSFLLSPRGARFTQTVARRLAKEERIILVCGRYEGVDERIAEHYVDEELSIGDYILNGGEVAAMTVVESLFRLLPGAVGCADSIVNESFETGLLEEPQYTRPEDFRGHRVPEVLLSGHHEKIAQWRREKAREKTADMRSDLLTPTSGDIRFSIALVHYPVAGKEGNEMVSSITSIDIHDFARLGKTYGAQRVFIVTPVRDQHALVDRIKGYWTVDEELNRLTTRRTEALDLIEVAPSVEAAIASRRAAGVPTVKLLTTSASDAPDAVDEAAWRTDAQGAGEWLILFGTAYGLGQSLMERADRRLKPLAGSAKFNHLPVRAASAIILDRLFGTKRREQS